MRPSSRAPEALRPVTFEPGIAPHASGSTLVAFGQTRVICAATLEPKVPGWMNAQNIPGGWITAEYALLPYATLDRKPREVTRGKQEGRTVEIQRLIGRSLRAVVDLKKLPGHTLWIDCDVLQADGGTRTAAITGAYVAASLAVDHFLREGRLKENPFRDSVAAVSVGIYRGQEVLDLDYAEDREASVDANIVMTGQGHFVEVQSSGEEATYTREQLDRLLILASDGIRQLTALQTEAIAAATPDEPATGLDYQPPF